MAGLRIAEVPTTLRRWPRAPPHLRSWRDGWRHLRFLLLFSPRWLFLTPGNGAARPWPDPRPAGDARAGNAGRHHPRCEHAHRRLRDGRHRLPGGALRTVHPGSRAPPAEGFLPEDPKLSKLLRGLDTGTRAVDRGACSPRPDSPGWWHPWPARARRPLRPPRPHETSLRVVVPAVTALILSCQAILGTFLLAVLGIRHTAPPVAASPPDRGARAIAAQQGTESGGPGEPEPAYPAPVHAVGPHIRAPR